jgi:DNA-directed RNA polymerase specialized sigma24 family protein
MNGRLTRLSGEPLAGEHSCAEGPGAVQLMARVARGQRRAQLEFLEAVGFGVQRTLLRLVGCQAPIEPLLEASLLRAVNRAPEYRGDVPLALWSQSIAVEVATTYLGDAAAAGAGIDSAADAQLPPKVRDLLTRVHAILRKMRPEEQVAFALLELDGRSLGEASSLMRASPIVVRQRASRVRRQLLFAARSDQLIAGYVRLAEQLRRLAGRLSRLRLQATLDSDSLRRAQRHVAQILMPEPHHP